MGSVISTDLAETFDGEVVIAGRNLIRAREFARSFRKSSIYGAAAEANNDAQMSKVLAGVDVLINATNYYFNIAVMRQALKNRVNYVDLGGLYHMTKKQLKLDSLFRKQGKVAILGCGSTPGITNILAHYGSERFDRIYTIDISFADKDYTKYNQPFVVPYSMQTVFDEFTKKPAVFANHKMHFVEPLSGEKYVSFPKPVGRVLCRYSLHSELASIPQNMRDKGIKNCSFRGGWDEDFISKTKFLIDAGFASESPVNIGGKLIVPRKITAALLDRFLPPSNIKINDVEFLRVEITGTKNGKRKSLAVYCKAFSNKKHNIPAGSWDTGVPPSIIAQEICSGNVKYKGVTTPEKAIPVRLFLEYLKARGMEVFTKRS